MFQDAGAGSLISARDCALTIGITYFLSALLSLVMKNLMGRRRLMLISLLGKRGQRLPPVSVYSLHQLSSVFRA